MSSITLTPTEQTRLHNAKPSFIGLVGGELFKVTRMVSTWVSFILMLLFIVAPNILLMLVSNPADNFKQGIAAVSLHEFYNIISIDFLFLRVFIGFFLIILTANVIGREYQNGTIRIMLARGVGRVQLLLAKVSAVVLAGLMTYVIWLLVMGILICCIPLAKAGNLNALQALNSDFWHNVWLYQLTILISMGATMLMTVALCAIGRSLAFGLAAAGLWFPIDNIVGTLAMAIAFEVTKNDFWKNLTAYFLGPNLNQMAATFIPAYITNRFAGPLVQVDSTHTVLVALVYSVIFAVVAVVLTARRDVKE